MLAREVLETAMRRALELAERGPAKDANPQVGCVILDPAGAIVAEGWHRGAGTPHAEIAALAALPDEWRSRAHELTAVVTLEPCNHTGRTGPCAVAISAARIGTVAFSVSDPGDASSGGSARLRHAGVRVLGGVLEPEGLELLEPWFARQRHVLGRESATPSPGRAWDVVREAEKSASPLAPMSSELPSSAERGGALSGIGAQSDALPQAPGRIHVTVKWAQTLDGRAAAADGSSQWITGPAARLDVHRRRAEADAILVGTGTLLADNPALTARGDRTANHTTDGGSERNEVSESTANEESTGGLLVPAAEQPIPVVLGRREIPADARINEHPALNAHGLAAPLQFAGDDLSAHLKELGRRGVRSVFVEGGPTVASAFIRAGLADEVLIYLAPALLGGPKLAIGDLGIESMAGIRRLRIDGVEHLGDDLLIRASFHHQPESKEGR